MEELAEEGALRIVEEGKGRAPTGRRQEAELPEAPRNQADYHCGDLF
jgi:hypothetical protein